MNYIISIEPKHYGPRKESEVDKVNFCPLSLIQQKILINFKSANMHQTLIFGWWLGSRNLKDHQIRINLVIDFDVQICMVY